MNNTLSHFLKNCKTLETLKSVHAHLLIRGSVFSSDLTLNKILRLYSRYGSTDYAHKLFDKIPQPNPFLYSSMIHGYVENFKNREAFLLLYKMRVLDVPLLNFTILSILRALGREKRLRDGEGIYGFVIKYGLGFDLLVQNGMIDFFVKCGEVYLGRRMFDGIEERDVVSWNTMISGYWGVGRVEDARQLFDGMLERNVVSWTILISGYVKMNDMVEARRLFEAMPVKDLTVWNVMVSGYVEVGDIDAAHILFETTPVRDVAMWNLMISGFCKVGEMVKAKEYFEKMSRKNVSSWTIMVDGFAKSGNMNEARHLFDQMPEKNLFSWSAIIGGYAKNGQPHAALKLLECFKETGIQPDETFILGIISACSQLGIADVAESIIHNYVGTLYSNTHVVTSLIDMYAKCGRIEKASQVFEMADQKDFLCYSTMIAAFGNHGLVQEAITLFHDMKMANIKPDAVTFLGVLSACNHGGLVAEGRSCFKQMIEEYNIKPTEKHYACMVDLLGRAGLLEEAYNLICDMYVPPTAVVWGSLLGACKVYGNVHLAEIAAVELFKIEPENSGNYVLLSSIYAAFGRWRDVAKVRAMIRERGVRKNRGSSWIEFDSVVHEFVMGDMSHLDSDRIYFMLDLLCEEMKLLGDIVSAKYRAGTPLSAQSVSIDFENG
ncbi:Pentatricopeptide repeat-containing protein [Forsythia ovata]|uniref:Pentatricopeptide repeat-containing protein n=1 Tax=Forsythia ovata TaxID=205694 RepID=A0ABD1T7E6_9LAMI